MWLKYIFIFFSVMNCVSFSKFRKLLNFSASTRTNKDSSYGLPWLASDSTSLQVPSASPSRWWLVQGKVHAGGLGSHCHWNVFLWQVVSGPKSHQRWGWAARRIASVLCKPASELKDKVPDASGWAQLHWQTLRRLGIKLYVIWIRVWLLRYTDHTLWRA